MNLEPLASRLEGKQIGKWTVREKRQKTPEDNSGSFSSCYKVVSSSGQVGFLKAFNYTYAFGNAGSSADIMNRIVQDFRYERDLLGFCADHKMRRVVTAIDSGEYREPGEIPVPFLVFEIADGSLKVIQSVKKPDLAWKLSVFHDALVGLAQLHSHKIVHQDIKPSNILVFGNKIGKIADLGRATGLERPSNFHRLDCCFADRRYAPVELLYGYFSPDWDTRRFGSDFFMMGGILTFQLCDVTLLHLLLSKLPEDYLPSPYGRGNAVTFDQAKPFLIKAYFEILEQIRPVLHETVREDLLKMIAQFCHPVPEERGNTVRLQQKGHRQYSLQRYISVTDRLAKKLRMDKHDRHQGFYEIPGDSSLANSAGQLGKPGAVDRTSSNA